MPLIKKLSARLQNHPKRIVYPEGADPRILQAARQFSTRKLGVPILLGNRDKIEQAAASVDVPLRRLWRALPPDEGLPQIQGVGRRGHQKPRGESQLLFDADGRQRPRGRDARGRDNGFVERAAPDFPDYPASKGFQDGELDYDSLDGTPRNRH